MPMTTKFIFFYILLSLLLATAHAVFCSAKCTYTFDGAVYQPQCSGPTAADCTSCDTSIFNTATPCTVNATTYTLAVEILSPPDATSASRWTISDPAVVNYVPITLGSVYDLMQFTGPTTMFKSFALATAHSAVRLRMFVMTVNKQPFSLNFYIDKNLTNPISVNTSIRTFLNNATYDSFIFTSPDVAHTAGTVDVSMTASGIALPLSSTFAFGIKQLLILTKNCPAECVTCTLNGSCGSCNNVTINGNLITYVLAGKNCLTFCTDGFLPNANNPNLCDACITPCKTCQTTTLTCTSCFTDSYFKYLENYNCVGSCSFGYYLDGVNYTCKKCHASCLACSGAGNGSCVSCNVDANGQQYVMWATGGVCGETCPQGEFLSTYLACDFCDPKCLRCVGSATNCFQCRYEGDNSSYLLQHNYTCVLTCPTNFRPAFNRSCICNQSQGYYLTVGYSCLPCASACKTCNGSTWDQCLTCAEGYYLLAGSTKCRTICTSGTYPVATTNKCAYCDSTCYTCSSTPSFCTGCSGSRYLLNGICLTTCPQGYRKSQDPNVCAKCAAYEFTFNGRCVSVCPAGYMPVGVSCVLSQTASAPKHTFTVEPTIVNKGTRLSIKISLSYPLSKSAALGFTDFNVSIVKMNQFGSSQRLLNTIVQNLDIQAVDLDDDRKTLKIFTKLPTAWDVQKYGLSVYFSERSLVSEDSISFDSFNILYPLSEAAFVSQLYKNYYKSNLDVVGIVSTCLGIIMLALSFWSKYAFYSCLEFFMTLQMYSLLVFVKKPIEFNLFAFLRGFDNSRFQFLPSIFQFGFPAGYKEHSIEPFALKTTDMNFFRLTGSIVLFLSISILPMGYAYFYDKEGLKKGIKWIRRVIVYLASITIIFGIFSSFYSLFLNTELDSHVFILSQICAFGAIVPMLIFFKRQRRGILAYKLFLIGYLVSCMIFPLFSLRAPLILILYDIVQTCLLIYFYSKVRPETDIRWLPCMLQRIGFLLSVNSLIISKSDVPTIAIVCTSLSINFLGVLLIFYKGCRKQEAQRRQDHQPVVNESRATLDNNQQKGSHLESIFEKEKFSSQVHQSIDKELYIKQDHAPSVIYQHSVQQSPARRPGDNPQLNEQFRLEAVGELKSYNRISTARPRKVFQGEEVKPVLTSYAEKKPENAREKEIKRLLKDRTSRNVYQFDPEEQSQDKDDFK